LGASLLLGAGLAFALFEEDVAYVGIGFLI
jgi:hypothetical protein